MANLVFVKDAVERAARTAAQAAVAVLVADGTGLFTMHWWAGLSAAAGMAVLSLLTSLDSGVTNPDGTASLVSLARGSHAGPFAEQR